MEYKRFRIPNRDVKLTELEAMVTRTRAFQRLFYLKQLGLAHLVYPCATHTRAGHSIECLDEAARLLESIGVREKGDGWDEVRMAALLHDIGHVPFGHTLEDENQVLPKHDKGGRVDRVLTSLKNELNHKNACELIDRAKSILLAIAAKDEHGQDWRSDLVGNTVCADLLAYITTDAAWTGIEKRPGYYRVYDYFTVNDKPVGNGRVQKRLCIRLTKGGLRPDIVSAILDLLDMRYALTERVLFHHAKAVASAMLARSARLTDLRDEPALLQMGDEAFLDYLQTKAKEHPDKTNGQGALMLLQQLRSRNLHKRIFKVQWQAMVEWDKSMSSTDADTFCAKWRDSHTVEQMLTKIEDRFGLPRGALVLWCPDGKSGMKLVRVNVTWEQPGGWHSPVELRSDDVKRQFPGVHERVATIEHQYLDLWTFWIGMHPEHVTQAPAVIDALEGELQIKCDSVFIKTYATPHLPGFAKAARTYGTVDNTWRTKFAPEVSKRASGIAARENAVVDESTVGEAIHSVSEEERKVTKEGPRRKETKQPDLLNLAEQEEKNETKEPK